MGLWPWKKGDSSPDFEKVLSTLSRNISEKNAKNEKLRQQSRRVKLVWLLYAGFAYILAVLILTLVSGTTSWGPLEYTAVAGGPVFIYLIRRGLASFFDYRMSSIQTSLDSLYRERDETIEKLKTATKYNTTHELLEKYGSAPPSPSVQNAVSKETIKMAQSRKEEHMRTNMAPPPTANIRKHPNQPPRKSSPLKETGHMGSGVESAPEITAEFAPNAFMSSSPPEQAARPNYEPVNQEHRWYDRLLDVLLGDDETQARNRVALICSSCRLVNGLAPPGTSRSEDIGRWRCGSCGAWNGIDNVASAMAGKDTPKSGGVQSQSEEDLGHDESTAAAASSPSSDEEDS